MLIFCRVQSYFKIDELFELRFFAEIGLNTERYYSHKRALQHGIELGIIDKNGIEIDKPSDLQQQLASATNTINRQAEKITELEAKLASIKAGKDTQNDTPADSEPTDKGQGDSLLILGAVMATMPKLKPNYTQQSHITEILETYKNVSGISQSTLEKKFSQAKRYLKQCIN